MKPEKLRQIMKEQPGQAGRGLGGDCALRVAENQKVFKQVFVIVIES